AVFDYYREADGVPDQQCFMVSTLSIPQRPVALCGPNRAFADALCSLLNSVSTSSSGIRQQALEEALKPFALVNIRENAWPDDYPAHAQMPVGTAEGLTIGDFRRAREALSSKPIDHHRQQAS